MCLHILASTRRVTILYFSQSNWCGVYFSSRASHPQHYWHVRWGNSLVLGRGKGRRRQWHPTLAWKIPWMEEPGGPQSMGSLRVGQDSATSLSLFTFMHWRRKWQPTPVFLPGESQGWGSLVGCHLWGHIESDTTEATQQRQQQQSYQ